MTSTAASMTGGLTDAQKLLGDLVLNGATYEVMQVPVVSTHNDRALLVARLVWAEHKAASTLHLAPSHASQHSHWSGGPGLVQAAGSHRLAMCPLLELGQGH